MTNIWDPLAGEINLITRPDIRQFVEFALEAAPAYFWSVPASTSGKYHPTKCRQPGGLVHHTRMVVYFVNSLMISMNCEHWHDELIAAAILHDAYKNGESLAVRSANWPAHGLNLRGLLQRQGWWSKYGHEQYVDKILDLTARHMSKWGGSAPRPASMEDWALAIADYVASRKLVNIDQFDESKVA